MYDSLLEKLLNPDLQFLAIYVTIIVILAYIALLFQFFKIKHLKQENELLKQQSNQLYSSDKTLKINSGMVTRK